MMLEFPQNIYDMARSFIIQYGMSNIDKVQLISNFQDESQQDCKLEIHLQSLSGKKYSCEFVFNINDSGEYINGTIMSMAFSLINHLNNLEPV